MKQVIKIDSIEQYRQIVSQYNRKGRLTNDYMQGDAANLITHNQLYTLCGKDNAALLVKKESFMRLYYYINNAGGFTDNAKRSRIYGISQSGAVTKLHANSVRDIEPGMNIVVPQKSSKKKMSTAEKIGIFSGIASLAAVIVAVLNVIKK